MKPTLILYVFLLSFSLTYGQNKKEILADIKNKYSLIRELIDTNTLRQLHTDYTCQESLEKGSITFYYNSRELKHIVHKYTQGRVTYEDEYYVWDDELFFEFSKHKVRYKDYERSKKKKIKKVNVVLTLEERFYFYNLLPIKCQFKDFETRSNRSKNPKTNYVRNKNTDCENANKVLEKYAILLEYQDMDMVDTCDLPRSIAKIISDDVIYGSLGRN
ncbi:hypothetical protein [Aquimarina litoralis]|uniref:hypothetical protein n=1 Tax=Aquimarina litoralis TaxID=584605 RepID=UPI001C599D9C|nr:hypothetical protein [Aquimarina litoralis]MBW1297541.1 hypothetical protein [Aquimarina litoralis]